MAGQPVRRIEANSLESARIYSLNPDLRMPARVREAHRILQVGFTVAPIVAGIDKFFGILTNWDQYLAPTITNLLHIGSRPFMQAVGVVEIIAGIGVAMRPRIFGYVVSAWLGGIIINLLMTGQYFDIALRDFGLSLSAFALARLSDD